MSIGTTFKLHLPQCLIICNKKDYWNKTICFNVAALSLFWELIVTTEIKLMAIFLIPVKSTCCSYDKKISFNIYQVIYLCISYFHFWSEKSEICFVKGFRWARLGARFLSGFGEPKSGSQLSCLSDSIEASKHFPLSIFWCLILVSFSRHRVERCGLRWDWDSPSSSSWSLLLSWVAKAKRQKRETKFRLKGSNEAEDTENFVRWSDRTNCWCNLINYASHFSFLVSNRSVSIAVIFKKQTWRVYCV